MVIELTVIFAAFAQELVPAVPSLAIFIPAGAALNAQGASLWHVAIVVALTGVSRVLAGLILYTLSAGASSRLLAKRGRRLGVSKRQIDRVTAKLGTTGSWWAVFWLWALPIVPCILISLAAGFVKVPRATFVSATYVGALINAATFLLIGYYGLHIVGQ
ncbi:MAG TPA: VTT domain-containing protein [Bacillota bacterium]|nr:VTT domain-containing protein [Bacillota bacterium]